MSTTSAALAVEPAKSSRSACRSCKEKIEKGVLRVGHDKFTWRKVPNKDEPVRNTLWHHLECIDHVDSYVTEDPETYIEGFADLDDEEKSTIMDFLNAIKSGDATAPEDKASSLETYDVPPYKDPSEGMLSHLKKRTVDKLKNELELNGQAKTGKKDDLIQRVAFGRTNGAIPQPCKVCGGGKLKFVPQNNTFLCPGYYDESAFKSCNTIFNWNQVQLEEWKWPADDSPDNVTKEEDRLEAEKAELAAAIESEPEVVESDGDGDFEVESEGSPEVGTKRRVRAKAPAKPKRQGTRRSARQAAKTRKPARKRKVESETEESEFDDY
ncbi:hypothetical protein P9112_010496 [Eukaryota sp. TZLM1-RC]